MAHDPNLAYHIWALALKDEGRTHYLRGLQLEREKQRWRMVQEVVGGAVALFLVVGFYLPLLVAIFTIIFPFYAWPQFAQERICDVVCPFVRRTLEDPTPSNSYWGYIRLSCAYLLYFNIEKCSLSYVQSHHYDAVCPCTNQPSGVCSRTTFDGKT